MSHIWRVAGRLAFWLGWPGLWLYLYRSQRTRVLITHDDQLLLVQGWLSAGTWEMPGGGRHRHESALAAAQREIREETGLSITPEQFTEIGSFQARGHGFRYQYTLLRVALVEQAQTVSQRGEIVAVQWFSRDELADIKLSPQLKTALVHWPR